MKRGKSTPAIILLLLLIAGILLITIAGGHAIHNIIHLGFVSNKTYTVAEDVVTLKPGSVYKIVYTKLGPRITETSSQLIERLNLSSVDIGVNDVVAPILYDWWFDGSDDYLYWTFQTGNFSYIDVRAGVDADGNGVITENLVSTYGFSLSVNPSIELALAVYNGSKLANIFDSQAYSGYHDVEAVFDGSSMKLYKDGVEVAEAATDIGYSWFSTDTIAIASQVPLGNTLLKGRISYVEYQFRDLNGNSYHYLFSASFYNGTTYVDLVHGTPLSVAGNPARVPTEHPKLLLEKELASDNKLHLRYVPPGSIFRIIYNGMVYEWRIDGTPNAAGLIEDYPIDIASIFGSTVLPNATIELLYPSSKVRIYGYDGMKIEVVSGNTIKDYVINGSYVDIPVNDVEQARIKIIASDIEEPNINVYRTGDIVYVSVRDKDSKPIPNAYVRVESAGNVIASGYTDDRGLFKFTYNGNDKLQVIVHGFKDGIYYSLSSQEILPVQPPDYMKRAGNVVNNNTTPILIITLLVAIIIVVVAKGGKRRRLLVVLPLLLLLAMKTVLVANAATTQLDWKDTGFNLVHGYKYLITLSVDVKRYPGFLDVGTAEVQAGGFSAKIGYASKWFGTKLWLELHIADQTYKLDEEEFGTGFYTYSKAITIVVDCDGAAKVYADGQLIDTFNVPDSGYDILKNIDKHGRVSITYEKLGCNSGSGSNSNNNNPPPTDYEFTRDNWMHRLGSIFATGATVFIVLAAVLLAIMIAYSIWTGRKPGAVKWIRAAAILSLVLVSTHFFLIASSVPSPSNSGLHPLAWSPEFAEWKDGVVIIKCGKYYGTGFWVSDDHIVTAGHVVNYEKDLVCDIIKGNNIFKGTVVGVTRDYDLAVLEVSKPKELKIHIFPVRVNGPLVGEQAYVIGYPAELLAIYNDLSKASENPRLYGFEIPWFDPSIGLLEIGYTDEGNSGGPVVDANGNIIGVVSFAMKTGIQYLFYATSSTKLSEFLAGSGISYKASWAQPEGAGTESLKTFMLGLSGGIIADVIVAGIVLFSMIILHRKR